MDGGANRLCASSAKLPPAAGVVPGMGMSGRDDNGAAAAAAESAPFASVSAESLGIALGIGIMCGTAIAAAAGAPDRSVGGIGMSIGIAIAIGIGIGIDSGGSVLSALIASAAPLPLSMGIGSPPSVSAIDEPAADANGIGKSDIGIGRSSAPVANGIGSNPDIPAAAASAQNGGRHKTTEDVGVTPRLGFEKRGGRTRTGINTPLFRY